MGPNVLNKNLKTLPVSPLFGPSLAAGTSIKINKENSSIISVPLPVCFDTHPSMNTKNNIDSSSSLPNNLCLTQSLSVEQELVTNKNITFSNKTTIGKAHQSPTPIPTTLSRSVSNLLENSVSNRAAPKNRAALPHIQQPTSSSSLLPSNLNPRGLSTQESKLLINKRLTKTLSGTNKQPLGLCTIIEVAEEQAIDHYDLISHNHGASSSTASSEVDCLQQSPSPSVSRCASNKHWPTSEPDRVCALKHGTAYTAAVAQLKIHHSCLPTILDTGASISCISEAWFNSLPAKLQDTKKEAKSFNAVTAGNTKLPCVGTIDLQLAFPNHEWTDMLTWHIIPQLPYDALVGMDFIARNKGIINTENGTFTITPRYAKKGTQCVAPICWFPNDRLLPVAPLALIALANLSIEPECTNHIPCFTVVDNTDDWLDHTGIVSLIQNDRSYWVPAAMVKFTEVDAKYTKIAHHSQAVACTIAVTNFSDQTLFLRRGTNVAYVSPMQHGDTVTLIADPATPGAAETNEKMPPTPHPSRAHVIAQTGQPPQLEYEQPSTLPYGVVEPDTFDLPNIAPENRPEVLAKIRKLLSNWLSVFSAHDHDFGHCTVETLFIELLSDTPQYQKPYNIPHHLRPEVKRQFDLLYEHGVIEDANSPFSAPIVLVAKKDGSVRICLDFRRLNAITKKDGYPLPRIDTALSSLRGAKVFSALDLNGGYHQIAVNKEDRHKLAVTFPWGQYQFVRAPFGVANMPAVFSRMMNKVFAGVLWMHVLIYLDDILVFSSSVEEHMSHLEDVFARLHSAGLKLKGKKCHFFMDEVQYLGHRVSSSGIKVDPDKVVAIKDKPYPTNIKELRSDLGLFSYYRQFVHNFSHVAAPLTQMLGLSPADKALAKKLREDEVEVHKINKKIKQNVNAKWEWGQPQKESYDALRAALISTPILAHPNFEKPFIVDTDASLYALGAVCSQLDENGQETPVAYASRTLSKSERNYSPTKREALGVYWAVHLAFHPFTYGAPFLLRTDHSSLTRIFNQGQPLEPVVAGWQMQLMAYTFEIQHRPGKDHSNADGMSRPSEHNLAPATEDPQVTYPERIAVCFISSTNDLATPQGGRNTQWENFLPVLAITRYQARGPTAPQAATTSAQILSSEDSASSDEDSAPTTSSTSLPHTNVPPKAGAPNSVQLDGATLAQDPRTLTLATLQAGQSSDPLLSQIRAYILRENKWQDIDTNTRMEASRCSIINDLVYVWVLEQRSTRQQKKEARVWVPTTLTTMVLTVGHDIPLSGHLDVQRTFHRISSTYWWPNLWHDIVEFLKTCPVCQFRKVPRLQKKGIIHDGFKPTYPFQYVSMDVTELIHQNTSTYLLVFVDLFTRWVEVQVLEDAPTAETIAYAFLTVVVSRHGTPEFLISDNGPNMVGIHVTDVCIALQTHRITTSPYRPQANGAVERFNRTIKNILATLTMEHRAEWPYFLPHVLHAYRTAYHASLQDSPFFLLYGRDPRCPAGITDPVLLARETLPFRTDLIERAAYARKMVMANLDKAGHRAKQTFNDKAREHDPLDGLVLLRYRDEEKQPRSNIPKKLRDKWRGPYRVIRQVAPVTYDIQLLGSLDVIRAHRNDLKPFYPRTATPLTAAEPDPTDHDHQLEVSKIVDHKWLPNRDQLYYRVRWKGLTALNDTWEPLSSLVESASEILHDYIRLKQSHNR